MISLRAGLVISFDTHLIISIEDEDCTRCDRNPNGQSITTTTKILCGFVASVEKSHDVATECSLNRYPVK